MPVPYAPLIILTDHEQAQLESLTRAHTTPQALAFRCRLILRAAAPDHPSNLRLATEMHCDRHTVRLWRTRYRAQGLAGLQDAPRSGRPRRFSPQGPRGCGLPGDAETRCASLPSDTLEYG